MLANALRLQGDLDGALKAIREAHEIFDKLPTTSQTLFDRYAILLREAFILGEDRGISWIVPLKPSFCSERLSRCTKRPRVETRTTPPAARAPRPRVASLATSCVGAPRRKRWPSTTLALGRLDEIKNNLKARRDKALVLASSSYALTPSQSSARGKAACGRSADHPERNQRLSADRIRLDSELRSVLQATADHHADEGPAERGHRAIRTAARESPGGEARGRTDLRDAYASHWCTKTSPPAPVDGATKKADAIDAKRPALWNHWNRKLPNNPFVLRRLAQLSPDAAGAGSVCHHASGRVCGAPAAARLTRRHRPSRRSPPLAGFLQPFRS